MLDRGRKDQYEIEFTVGGGEGNRSLFSYLCGIKKISVKAIRRIKNGGAVFINDVPALLGKYVEEGDRVLLAYPPEKKSPYLEPQEVPLNIVFEDRDILVLDKQSGVCVHPTRRHPRGTLANGVLYHWARQGEHCAPHFVNRLDKDTSGLILIAKNTYGAQQCFRQQREGMIKRRYLALVLGELPGEGGSIDLPIAREDKPTVRRMISEEGQPSLTHYRVLERYTGHTLLDLSLETGRTHQIRVHLSHLGYPILGDKLYGGETTRIDRQFLHAYRLSFYHPVDRRKREFVSGLPAELTAVLHNML